MRAVPFFLFGRREIGYDRCEAGFRTESCSREGAAGETDQDMVKALEPEIRRALPAVLTLERFTRMALSAIHNTPELANCTPTRNPCG